MDYDDLADELSIDAKKSADFVTGGKGRLEPEFYRQHKPYRE
jgi:hypothetical protein